MLTSKTTGRLVVVIVVYRFCLMMKHTHTQHNRWHRHSISQVYVCVVIMAVVCPGVWQGHLLDFVGRLICDPQSQTIDRYVWLNGWLVGWLAGWLAGWMDGWMDGWLVRGCSIVWSTSSMAWSFFWGSILNFFFVENCLNFQWNFIQHGRDTLEIYRIR